MVKKIKEVVEKSQKSSSKKRTNIDRRRSDRRWMSKLVGGPEVPFERRSGSDRRMGDRRKK